MRSSILLFRISPCNNQSTVPQPTGPSPPAAIRPACHPSATSCTSNGRSLYACGLPLTATQSLPARRCDKSAGHALTHTPLLAAVQPSRWATAPCVLHSHKHRLPPSSLPPPPLLCPSSKPGSALLSVLSFRCSLRLICPRRRNLQICRRL